MKKVITSIIIIGIVVSVGVLFGISTAKKMHGDAIATATPVVTQQPKQESTPKPTAKPTATPKATPAVDSEEVEALKERISELEAEIASSSQSTESNDFLSILFFKDKDGTQYENTDKNVYFYRDEFCSKPANDELTFTSVAVYEVKLENGNKVYCAMTNSGLVWSTKCPSLRGITAD